MTTPVNNTDTRPRSARRRTVPLAAAVTLSVAAFLVGAGTLGGGTGPAVRAAPANASTKACSLVPKSRMSEAIGADVRTVVPSSSANATSCQYQLAGSRQSVTLALLTQRVQAETFDAELKKMTAKLKSPVERVPGIGDDAYALMLRSIADLQVRVDDRALTVIIVGRDHDEKRARLQLERIGRAAVAGLRAADR